MLRLKSVCLKLSGLFLVISLAFSAFAQENNDKKTEEENQPIDSKTIEDSNTPDKSGKINYRPKRGAKEYNFEPGFAPFDPTHYTGEKTYNTAGRKLGTFNVRFGRVIGTKKAITFTYLFGVTPFAISLQNEVENSAYISPQLTPNEPKTIREHSYGIGFTPFNMRFTFFPKSRIKPFAQVAAGVLITNKPMPIPETGNLNFTGEYGGGFLFHRSQEKMWILGYRYFHISNGNLTPKRYNPGYNANVFYIGYSFFR